MLSESSFLPSIEELGAPELQETKSASKHSLLDSLVGKVKIGLTQKLFANYSVSF